MWYCQYLEQYGKSKKKPSEIHHHVKYKNIKDVGTEFIMLFRIFLFDSAQDNTYLIMMNSCVI